MPKGNASDPFTVNGGIDWDKNGYDPSGFKANGSGSSPKEKWGQPDSAVGPRHLDKYSNRDDKGAFEFGIGNEKTVLDKPINASPARAGKGQAYNSNPYSAGPGRKG